MSKNWFLIDERILLAACLRTRCAVNHRNSFWEEKKRKRKKNWLLERNENCVKSKAPPRWTFPDRGGIRGKEILPVFSTRFVDIFSSLLALHARMLFDAWPPLHSKHIGGLYYKISSLNSCKFNLMNLSICLLNVSWSCDYEKNTCDRSLLFVTAYVVW